MYRISLTFTFAFALFAPLLLSAGGPSLYDRQPQQQIQRNPTSPMTPSYYYSMPGGYYYYQHIPNQSSSSQQQSTDSYYYDQTPEYSYPE